MGDTATPQHRRLAGPGGLSAALVLLAAFLTLDGTLAAEVLYLLVVGTAAAVAWSGLRWRPARLGPVLIAVGLSLSSLGDLLWQTSIWLGNEPDVSVADAAYLGGYLALGVGLSAMAGATRQPGRERVDGWLDAMVVFVAALLVMWHVSIADTVVDTSVPLGTRAVWAIYPALDAALIALVFRLVVGGRRRDPAALAVAAGAVCWLVSDLGYLVAADQSETTALLDSGWMLGAVLLAVAARSGPAIARGEVRTTPERSGIGRLAVCLGALLVPGSLELLTDLSGGRESPLALYAATFTLVLLVFARTVRLLTAEKRAREMVRSAGRRSAALAAHSSDAVIVLDRSGRLLSDASRLAGLLGADEVDGGLSGVMASTGVNLGEARVVFERALAARGSVVSAELARQVDGVERWLGVRLVDLSFDPDVRGVVVHATDITERKRAEQTLAHQAFHDALTGLANRALFTDRVEQALRHNARHGDTAAIVFIDLDGFKAVNDGLGHQAGDVLLERVAERLTATVRAEDTLARLGGDEFAILVEQTGGAGEAIAAGDRVLAALRQPFRIGGQVVSVTGSVGVALSDEGATSDSLVRDADVAMYAAKAAGRGRVVLFDPQMRAAVVERRELECELQGALSAGQLRLVYQPVVELAGSTVVGFEALLRWQSPSLGPIAPDRFVPLAEDLGLIGEIGAWVLRQACAAAADWRRLPGGQDLTMAVNVSAVQLADPGLVGQIADALAASGLPAAALVVEVTETALVRDPDGAAQRLAALRELGVRLALDDFGTGYSSLSYLRQFTVDVLKIDRSFVSTIQGAELPPIVRGLIDLGRTLDLEIVAEGVELEVQRDQLRAARCELAQGYLFAAPLESADAERFLLRRTPTRLADATA